MSSSFHGHDVIDMLRESDAFHTRDSLVAAITARFGADARFETCSASRMTATQLVEFLAQRGKIVHAAGGFVVDPERVCQRNGTPAAGVGGHSLHP